MPAGIASKMREEHGYSRCRNYSTDLKVSFLLLPSRGWRWYFSGVGIPSSLGGLGERILLFDAPVGKSRSSFLVLPAQMEHVERVRGSV